MHLMPLVNKPFKSASHGNHVVVGVGGEHYDPFGEGIGTFRP